MRISIFAPVLVLSLYVLSPAVAATDADVPGAPAQLLPGDRVLLGTVEEIAGDQARITTGEVEPRYIPMNVRRAKGLPPLKKGDRVEITVNDQNLLVDAHAVGESSHHLIVHGRLVEPLAVGQQKAVIQNARSGQQESHFIRPLARSKVASIPLGIDAVFLLDELDQIVDVAFGSAEAIHRATELWQKSTTLNRPGSNVASGEACAWLRHVPSATCFPDVGGGN
ncbi:hypothetical protein [Candidatus Nitrospira bockiana]